MKRTALPLVLGLCSFLGGAAATMLLARGLPSAIGEPSASELDRISDRFQNVVKRVAPAVVAIEAVKPPQRDNPKSKTVEESGSGVLVRLPKQQGHLRADQQPRHADGRRRADHRQPGRQPDLPPQPQVWADPESDVALLLLDGRQPADRRRSATATPPASASGCWPSAVPFGLNQTVTHGIISARERGQISLGSTIRIKEFLQTDAAINPGSSGGPLVNLDGEVIGINTAIASNSGSNSGVAFSIPINLVQAGVGAAAGKGDGDARLPGLAGWRSRSRRRTR